MRHQTQAGAGRIALFDNIKGLLIILVVVGHVAHPVHNDNPAISCLFDVIYLFHMPLFVFVSGLFAKRAKNERGVDSNRILSFVLLAGLYQLALMLINGASLTPGRFLQFTSAPWYLLAMAYWYAAAPLLARLGWRRGMAFSLALSYASGFFDLSDGLLAISRSLAFLPWFAAGLYCPVERVVALKESRSRTVRAALAAAVALAAAIALARVLDAHAYDWFFQMVYGDNPYRALPLDLLGKTVAAATALVFSAAVLRLVPSRRSWLTVLGERTLGIYVGHRLVRAWLTFRTPLYGQPVLLDPVWGTLIVLGLSVVIVAVCSAPALTGGLNRILRRRWLPEGGERRG
ncbi:MAG TPA: acyltransferase family protein [Candidatus Olsenella excrementigallinarum]|nr:acyltransferase family protein [Candidatus Olsenella excrementigallinarum]